MEQPVSIESGETVIRGILHVPDRPQRQGGTVVVFLHGWSGCRLGPHRMFVKTARELADAGYPCLRFDFRGRGESEGGTDRATIDTMVTDTHRAVAFIADRAQTDSVVLLGICSGGKVAVAAAAAEPRITGLALWSAEPLGPLKDPHVKTGKSLSALKTYAAKAMQLDTWRRLLTGRVNVSLVKKAVLDHETTDRDEQARETALLEPFRSFAGRTCFIYGSRDPVTATAAHNYAAFCRNHGIPHEFHDIRDANHSFYALTWEREVIDLTRAWLAKHFL